MVAPHDIATYLGTLHTLHQRLRDQEVIQSPAGVVLAGVSEIAPVGIGTLLVRMQCPVGVHIAGVQKLGHSFPLFIGEAWAVVIRSRTRDINLLVGDIQVPAEDSRLAPL